MQRIPPLRPPPLPDPAALQDHVLVPGRGQQAAHRESGVSGADDDGVWSQSSVTPFQDAARP